MHAHDKKKDEERKDKKSVEGGMGRSEGLYSGHKLFDK